MTTSLTGHYKHIKKSVCSVLFKGSPLIWLRSMCFWLLRVLKKSSSLQLCILAHWKEVSGQVQVCAHSLIIDRFGCQVQLESYRSGKLYWPVKWGKWILLSEFWVRKWMHLFSCALSKVKSTFIANKQRVLIFIFPFLLHGFKKEVRCFSHFCSLNFKDL